MATGVRLSPAALLGVLSLTVVSCSVAVQSGSPSSEPNPTESLGSAGQTSPSLPVDPTPVPTPVLPTLGGWQVIHLATEGGYANSIAESDRGWVAVGTGPTGPGNPAIWYSPDGEAWTPVEDLPAHRGSLNAVMVGGPGFMVIGTTADIDFGAPYVWTSPDGRAWTASDLNAAQVAQGFVTGISAIGGNLLAAGGLNSDPEHGPAVMWRSIDGNHWDQTILEGGGTDGGYADPPLAFGGRIIAVGGGSNPPMGRVWFSSDGDSWELQPDDPIWVDAYVQDSAVVNGRLVAVGGVWMDAPYDPRPAIWTSADGITWSSAFAGPCCGSITKVSATSDGGIAIQDTIIYESDDGLDWRLAGTIGGFHGQIYDLNETIRYGQVLIGWNGQEFVLLVPPLP